jgi:hypothetical protein
VNIVKSGDKVQVLNFGPTENWDRVGIVVRMQPAYWDTSDATLRRKTFDDVVLNFDDQEYVYAQREVKLA